MGKDRGDDFREGKMTLPVILAYARGTPEERRFWEEAIAGFRTEDEDLAHAIELIRRHDCVGRDPRARAALRPARLRRAGDLPRRARAPGDGRGGALRGQPGLLSR
jgi:geranylgeranyl pyrophosphate synthase